MQNDLRLREPVSHWPSGFERQTAKLELDLEVPPAKGVN